MCSRECAQSIPKGEILDPPLSWKIHSVYIGHCLLREGGGEK